MSEELKKLEELLANDRKIIEENYKEIVRLKELCDKYEEEHKTTFEEWKKTINIIKEVRDNLENSIKSINEKLKNNKEPFEVIDGRIQYINDYRVVRLKAFRTKCKELLEILDKENI